MNESKYEFISIPYTVERKLYKYYSNIDYALDSIVNRRIHLDDPYDFNDPFDAAFYAHNLVIDPNNTPYETISRLLMDLVHLPKDLEPPCIHNIVNSVTRYLNQMKSDTQSAHAELNSLQDIYNQLPGKDFNYFDFHSAIVDSINTHRGFPKLQCRISCFSEIWDSTLMWSYYANKHHGVCVEYNLTSLEKTDAVNAEILRSISKVHYSPIRADILITQDNDSVLNFLLSKADSWAHEHEWRIICNTEEMFLPFDCISGVYLGINFPLHSEDYKKILKAANTYEDFKIYKCYMHPQKYRIHADLVHDVKPTRELQNAIQNIWNSENEKKTFSHNQP